MFPAKGGRSGALSFVAIVVAAISVALSTVAVSTPGPQGLTGFEGPTGAIGPQGPQGPTGPGSLMNHSEYSGPQIIEGICTHYIGSEVTITVPSTGHMVVTAVVKIGIDHTLGTRDVVNLYIGVNSSDCTSDVYLSYASVIDLEPTDAFYAVSLFVQKPFLISSSSGGMFTFCLNGEMLQGASSDTFATASLIAVFYPS